MFMWAKAKCCSHTFRDEQAPRAMSNIPSLCMDSHFFSFSVSCSQTGRPTKTTVSHANPWRYFRKWNFALPWKCVCVCVGSKRKNIRKFQTYSLHSTFSSLCQPERNIDDDAIVPVSYKRNICIIKRSSFARWSLLCKVIVQFLMHSKRFELRSG